jgi:hypothetical protein
MGWHRSQLARTPPSEAPTEVARDYCSYDLDVQVEFGLETLLAGLPRLRNPHPHRSSLAPPHDSTGRQLPICPPGADRAEAPDPASDPAGRRVVGCDPACEGASGSAGRTEFTSQRLE